MTATSRSRSTSTSSSRKSSGTARFALPEHESPGGFSLEKRNDRSMGMRLLLSSLALSLACACGSGGGTNPNPDAGTQESTPQICPPIIYTGLVPASMMQPNGLKYSVPVLLQRGKTVSWSTDN